MAMESGVSFRRNLIELDEVDSTSTLARSLLMSDQVAELPMVIRARKQTQGRGRGDNVWWSDEGSLCWTLALDPNQHGLTLAHQPKLALVSALAVIDAITPWIPSQTPLTIRWPNDIESQDRKLGGILPERIETPSGPRILIGIGVNVSTQLHQAPPAVRQMATTLEELRNSPISSQDFHNIFTQILQHMETHMTRLVHQDPKLPARWSQLDALQGKPVRILQSPNVIQGTAAGIDSDGVLLLQTADGLQKIFGGQVLRL